MPTTTDIIESQADLNRLFQSVVDDFDGIEWTPHLIEEQRSMAVEHGKYFARAAGPSGEQWPPLSPFTIKKKGHDTILVETGRLRASLTHPDGSADSIRERVSEFTGSGAGYSFGTGVPYSAPHDRGQGQKKREHIGIDTQYFDQHVDRTVDFAFEGLKQ